MRYIISEVPSQKEKQKEHDMKKYNNLTDKYKIPITKKIITVLKPWGGDEIDHNNGDEFSLGTDTFYFTYKFMFNGVYQLEKSESNTNTEKISEFSDDYMLDGHHDEYEDFDQTNEVFEGEFSENLMLKITSVKLLELFNEKLIEFKKIKGEEECEYLEFFDWLGDIWDIMYPGDLKELIKKLGLEKEVQIEEIYSDVINNDGDIICWYQYSDRSEEEFGIEIKS